MLKVRRSPFLPIFLTVFIDMVGVGIVIPVVSPLFIAVGSPFAGADWSYALRTIFIGLLTACYPLAQFFGAPYLGALSDRWGRKPVLLISLMGTLVGYVFFALAIKWRLLWLLFASRTLDGFTGGNVSTVQSAISDLSDEKEKSRNFGITGTAFALGFIVGPYIGGKLADASVVSWFTPATPFWFAAILTFFNILVVAWQFDETLRIRLKTRMTFLTGINNIKRAFSFGELRKIYLVSFLFTAGFNFYIQFFQVLLIKKFGYSESEIGNLYGYVGAWIAITHVFATVYINRRWQPAQVLPWSLLLLAVTMGGIMFPRVIWAIYIIAPFMALAIGAANPNITATISNMADKRSQGEALGINQSISAAAVTIPPIISGFIVSTYIYLPLMLGALFALAAWAVFITQLGKHSLHKYHEV
jgi:DHA1 family tetracycline resistance protein-like MFS transporter